MKIQVYADIVFLINFCMDYILLAITCKIMVYKSTRLRCIIASAIGAVSSVCAFYMPSILGVPIQIAVGMVMCLICHPCKKRRDFISGIAVFYAVALLFGGGVLAVMCVLGADVLVKNGAFYIDIDIAVLAVSSGICYIIISVIEKIIKQTKTNCRKSVAICFMGKSIHLRGYVDTGNTLTCGGTPVILTAWDAVSPLMPNGSSQSDFFVKCPSERIRMASYKYVGGNGIIWCIIPDYIYVDGKSKNAVIGICPRTLSCEYDALLYAEM